MSNVTELIDRYIAMWNETDAARRRDLIAKTWTHTGRYLDPVMQGKGPENPPLAARKARPVRKVKTDTPLRRVLGPRASTKHQTGGDMLRNGSRFLLVTATAMALTMASSAGAADKKTIERGKYLVTLGGCFDCHTPGYFLGKPDMARYLGGS